MLQGHFVNSTKGKVFITQFGDLQGDTAILCLSSITEELNLARAVVAKQAKAFADNGLPCFILDYYGTGDSEGEFEQADTRIWQEDVVNACQWLTEQGVEKIILWGVRFGALLMFSQQAVLHQKFNIQAQLLWKPVTNGKIFAGQFLRIKQANNMMNNPAEKINWRQHILDGNETEVAGYRLNTAMLASIESLVIEPSFRPASLTHWFELASEKITPATERFCQSFDPAFINIQAFSCSPFWQVPEIFNVPDLNIEGVKALRLGNHDE